MWTTFSYRGIVSFSAARKLSLGGTCFLRTPLSSGRINYVLVQYAEVVPPIGRDEIVDGIMQQVVTPKPYPALSFSRESDYESANGDWSIEVLVIPRLNETYQCKTHQSSIAQVHLVCNLDEYESIVNSYIEQGYEDKTRLVVTADAPFDMTDNIYNNLAIRCMVWVNNEGEYFNPSEE